MLKIELSFFRCTRFRFGPLQENQIIPRLEHVATTENVEVTEDGKKALIALSGGDMRKVHTLRSFNDVTEGITQESPMGASWVIPRKVDKMV